MYIIALMNVESTRNHPLERTRRPQRAFCERCRKRKSTLPKTCFQSVPRSALVTYCSLASVCGVMTNKMITSVCSSSSSSAVSFLLSESCSVSVLRCTVSVETVRCRVFWWLIDEWWMNLMVIDVGLLTGGQDVVVWRRHNKYHMMLMLKWNHKYKAKVENYPNKLSTRYQCVCPFLLLPSFLSLCFAPLAVFTAARNSYPVVSFGYECTTIDWKHFNNGQTTNVLVY